MEKLKGTIESIDYEGLGIARVDGIPTFIENAIDGEEVEFKITEKKKNVMFGKSTKIIKESLDRVKPKCEYYYQCGGCNIMHMDYSKQLKFKKELTINTFNHVGHFDCLVNDCIGMDIPYNYRNKVQVPFSNDKVGFYKKGTHEICDMEKCLCEPEISFQIVNYLKKLFKKYNISSYDEKSKNGIIRHAVIKVSYKYKDVMLVIVTNSKKRIPNDLINDLLKEFKQIKTIIQNINMKNTNVVLGDEEIVLYGKGYILDGIFDLDFKIASKSFYQINTIQMEKLYQKAIEYASLEKDNVVIDAYSGIGSIALSMAKKVKHVYGIEIVKEAVSNALENKEINKIDNVDFILGPCEDMIKKTVSNKKIDVIIFDPPRKGCDEKFLETIVESKIKKIVYISCNIRTQARDIRYLLDNGYEIIEATPVDMFPNTAHVECVTLLERKKDK